MCDDQPSRHPKEDSMGGTLLEQVDGLADIIGSQAAAMEQERRISDDVLAGIRGTGLNRSLVPSALGGDDRHLLEVVEALERLAALDGSTGWCAAVGSGSNLFAGYLEPETAAKVFADPDQCNAGIFQPAGQVRPRAEGFALSGRWPFASNVLHSKWAMAGAFWFGDGDAPEPIPRLLAVPVEELEIETTWDAPGLSGTGSHHVSAKEVTVSRDQSLTFLDPAWSDGPLWRLPMFCILAPVLGCTPLGMARGAVDEVTRIIAEQVGATRGSLADDPVGLADFAVADTALRSARAGLFDACGRAWDHAERGERPPKTVQAQVMMAVNHGCEVAVEVTSTCHRLGGGSASYAGSSLLRRLRDVQTARQHIMFGFGHRPMLAKTLAGEDTFAPPFIT
jgi:alkylation response protein AidB-like acyl-CoA dehydrogenase